jgi:hypothetical protein
VKIAAWRNGESSSGEAIETAAGEAGGGGNISGAARREAWRLQTISCALAAMAQLSKHQRRNQRNQAASASIAGVIDENLNARCRGVWRTGTQHHQARWWNP